MEYDLEQFPEFEKVLERIRRGQSELDKLDLHALSGPSTAEAAMFEGVWYDLDVEDRRKVMQRLAESAEANFEMDFDLFFRAGLNDTDAIVRFHALEGLWESEDAALVDRLIKMMRTDLAMEVRAAAALCLGRFALKAELGELDQARSARLQDALVDVASDAAEDPEVSRRALEAAGYFDLEQVRELTRLAYEQPSTPVRASAMVAMGRSCDPFWTNLILDELTAPEPEIRQEAARAAGELQLQEAVEPLIELLSETDTQVQRAAVWALGQIGGRRARTALENMIEMGDNELAAAAEDALGELSLGTGPMFLFSYDVESENLDKDWELGFDKEEE